MYNINTVNISIFLLRTRIQKKILAKAVILVLPKDSADGRYLQPKIVTTERKV